MAEAVERPYAWVRPVAVVVAIVAFLAFVTALAADVDLIEDWLGVRDGTPVSVSLQIGKVVRPDGSGVVVTISYKKLGPRRLRDCKFWMDTGQLQLAGETPLFDVPRGPSTRDLQVPFRVGALWANDFPDATVTLSCDKTSSLAMPVSLKNLPAGQ
jgi:hypothetical protein